MKRKGMMLNDPILIIGDLKDITANATAPKNKIWSKKRNQET